MFENGLPNCVKNIPKTDKGGLGFECPEYRPAVFEIELFKNSQFKFTTISGQGHSLFCLNLIFLKRKSQL